MYLGPLGSRGEDGINLTPCTIAISPTVLFESNVFGLNLVRSSCVLNQMIKKNISCPLPLFWNDIEEFCCLLLAKYRPKCVRKSATMLWRKKRCTAQKLGCVDIPLSVYPFPPSKM